MIPEYDVYLFDADGTLFDFPEAEKNAFTNLLRFYQIPFTPELFTFYRTTNAALWDAFEKGEISKEDIQFLRFSRLLKAFSIDLDTVEVNHQYLLELGKGIFLLDGAFELCQSLYETGKKLYIITNGISISQKARLSGSLLRSFISDIFVSEDIGHQKPSPFYFDYVLSRIVPTEKKRILVIGDSLSADIVGGNGAGIDTCWFNPSEAPSKSGIFPTYEIKNLEEILKSLL